MTTIGDNVAALLRATYEQMIELEKEKIELKEERKSLVKTLKEYKAPAGQLVKIKKQNDITEEDREKKNNPMLEAGAILGLPAYVGMVDTSQIEHGHDPSVVADCEAVVEKIINIDSEITAINKDQKDELKAAKEAGLATKVIRTMVDFECYPERRQDFVNTGMVMRVYRTALGLTDSVSANIDPVKEKKEKKPKAKKPKAVKKPKEQPALEAPAPLAEAS